MRTFEHRTDSVDGASIDRLVDGDLPESERRELLLRLENDPEGWRRCALAFLEDQAWRKALTTPAPVATMPAPVSIPARPAIRTWFTRTSIAASLLASTFIGGYAAGGLSKASPRVDVATPNPKVPASSAAPARHEEVREMGSLEFVYGSAGESPPVRYPIRSGPGLDRRWLESQPPSVPDYDRARLERQGYQVAERRKLVSVELEDGRHVSIPVDEVAVDYVGQQPL